MKRPGLASTLLAFAATLAIAVVAAPASAARPTTTDADIAGALKRIANGTQSTADVALIRRDPELARTVVDPKPDVIEPVFSPNLVEAMTRSAAGNAAAVFPERCGWVESGLQWRSVWFGDVVLKWTQHVGACYDCAVITRFDGPQYDRIDYNCGTFYPRELNSSQSPTPSPVTRSFLQRHFEQCLIKYGCISTFSGWSEIIMYGTPRYQRTAGGTGSPQDLPSCTYLPVNPCPLPS